MTRVPSNRAPTHPGEMLLEEFIVPLGATQTEVAKRIRVSYPRLNEIIHGKRGITPNTALRLEKVFGMNAEFWLNLQTAWDLYVEKQSSAAKEIGRLQPYPGLHAPAATRG